MTFFLCVVCCCDSRAFSPSLFGRRIGGLVRRLVGASAAGSSSVSGTATGTALLGDEVDGLGQ